MPPSGTHRTASDLKSDPFLTRCKISLFLPEISLLPKIISLLIFAGNLPGNRCGTGAFRADIASKSPEIAKFPVNFPVSRELQAETGSYLTAHTTILASFRVPECVSCAIEHAFNRPIRSR
jgi:hypothetical protein